MRSYVRGRAVVGQGILGEEQHVVKKAAHELVAAPVQLGADAFEIDGLFDFLIVCWLVILRRQLLEGLRQGKERKREIARRHL